MLRLVFLAAIVATLAGCSGVYMTKDVSITAATDPLPVNYLPDVRALDPNAVEVSAPMRMAAWSIYEAAGWYVCARDAHGSQSVLALKGDRVDGVIANPGPAFCAKAAYGPLR